MPRLNRLLRRYPQFEEYETSWREVCDDLGATESVVGQSVEGRPLRYFDLGNRSAPTVLLTGLMHGIEVVGSLALFGVLDTLARSPRRAELLERLHLRVAPIVNPDPYAENAERHAKGDRAWRRCNVNGVDINRNFPAAGSITSLHPFSGSRWRIAPHYSGPAPFSEPESRAVRDLVLDCPPDVALGFHSFGNLLLFPWGYTREPNPRTAEYMRLASVCNSELIAKYEPQQAVGLYPTLGDLDDWLDAKLGCLSMTIEVGNLDRRLFSPKRLANPFYWMNPLRAHGTVANLVPGVLAMLEEVAAPGSRSQALEHPSRPPLPMATAAR